LQAHNDPPPAPVPRTAATALDDLCRSRPLPGRRWMPCRTAFGMRSWRRRLPPMPRTRSVDYPVSRGPHRAWARRRSPS